MGDPLAPQQQPHCADKQQQLCSADCCCRRHVLQALRLPLSASFSARPAPSLCSRLAFTHPTRVPSTAARRDVHAFGGLRRSLIVICHGCLASGLVFITAELRPPTPPFCRDQNCLVYPLFSPRMHYSFGVISTNGSLIFRLSNQTFFFSPSLSLSTPRPPRLRFTLLLPAAITAAAGAALTRFPFAVHHLLLALPRPAPPLPR